jgi:hypothetical protein
VKNAIWHRVQLGFLILGAISGCGKSAPEPTPDPALANKPFPAVVSEGDQKIEQAKDAGFPAVKSAGGRRRP